MSKRVTKSEGIELLKETPLIELKERAHAMRMIRNPSNHVTFVLDSNPNYTNVCNVDCKFCAFYRHKNAKDAYTKTVDQVLGHMKLAREAGLNTVLLQGGVNIELPLSYYTTLVKRCREEYPDIHPHFFSAVELWQVAKTEKISIEEVLQALWDAGQRTIPGGGAEILSERVRLEISPKKIAKDGWITVHKAAHKIGFRTTATMMYGHIETPEDIIEHFETIRQAQDQIPGFTSFIPWSYKRDRTALRRTVKHWAGKDAYFRILATARLYLDNFDHIGASWFGEGKEIGIESLSYGADDFGGTIMEENVHRATEWINKTDHNGMLKMIRAAGFEPAQRDTFHQVVRTYEGIEAVFVPPAGRVQESDQMKPLGILPESCNL